MTRVPVERLDWESEPMSDLSGGLDLDLPVPHQAMDVIRLGLLPREMEDKWFIFFEEPVLYAHRSWTGYEAFRMTFERREEEWRLVRVQVSLDPNRVNYGSVEDGVQHAIEVTSVCLFGSSHFEPEDVIPNWHMYGQATLGSGPKPGKKPGEGKAGQW